MKTRFPSALRVYWKNKRYKPWLIWSKSWYSKATGGSTVRNYRSAILPFLQFFQSREYDQVKKEEIESFVYHQITKYKISDRAQNTLINAIKAYYEDVLGNDRTVYEIQRTKRSMTLPNILSKEEVRAIFKNIAHLKHKTVMVTIYSGGLSILRRLS